MVAQDLFREGGNMGKMMRSHDWNATPLGVVSSWASSLRTVINLALSCNQPVCVWWGKELIQFYNDAYSELQGATDHPKAVGESTLGLWGESNKVMEPIFQAVREKGDTIEVKKQLVLINRQGYQEECYFNYTYSPITEETGMIGGVYCQGTEVTGEVVAERRWRSLQQLTLDSSKANTVKQACGLAMSQNPQDIPFGMVYLLGETAKQAYLFAKVGFNQQQTNLAKVISLGKEADVWNLAQVKQTKQPRVKEILAEQFGIMPGGFWQESPSSAYVMPLIDWGDKQKVFGFLVMGINPHQKFAPEYQGFFELLGKYLASWLASLDFVKAIKSSGSLESEGVGQAPISSKISLSSETEEKEIAQVKKNLEQLLCNVNDGFFSLDKEWRFTYVNHRQGEIMSLKEEEILGQNIWELFPEAINTEAYIQLHRGMQEQEVIHCEYLFEPWNRWFETHIYPDENGVVVLCSDITELKKSPENTQGSKSRLSLNQKMAQVGTWDWDLVNNTVIWSSECYGLFGLNPQTCQPSYEVWLKCICEEDRDQVIQSTILALAEKKNIEMEYRINHPEGLRWLHFKGKVISDETQEPQRMIGIVLDITEQKQLEAEKQRLLQELATEHATFENIFQQMPLGVIIAAKNSNRLVLANEESKKIIGFPSQHFLNIENYEHFVNFKGYYQDGSQYQLQDWPLLRSLNLGETVKHEQIWLKWEDGREILLDVSSSPILTRDGEIVAAIVTFEDITERQHIEQALRLEKERFELAANAVNCLIYDWNLETNIIERTEALTRLFGYLVEESEPTPQWWSELIHPDDLERVTTLAWAALTDRDHCVMEYRVRKKDNEYAYVLDHALIVRDASGKPVRIVGSTIDITEAKRSETERNLMEQAIKDKQERLRLTVEGAALGIWDHDLRSDTLFWSDRGKTMLGTSLNQMSYQSFRELLHEEDRDLVDQCVQEAVASGERVYLEYRVPQANGNCRWIAVSGQVYYDEVGQPIRSSGITQDITERKQAEMALRLSEHRFRQMAETIEAVFWIADFKQKKLIYVSPAYEKIWGRSVDSLYENFLNWIETIHPEDKEVVKNAGKTCIDAGNLDIEYRILRPDGSIRWIHDRGFIVKESPLQAPHTVGIAQDITERKLAEAALHESTAILNAINESSCLLIFVKDRLGRYLVANPATLQVIGMPAEGVIGHTDLDFTPNAGLAAQIMANDRRVMQTGEMLSYEEVANFSNDDKRIYLSIKFPYRDEVGNIIGLIGVATDITERKESEEALKRSEAALEAQRLLLETILKQAANGVIVCDASGHLTFVNPVARQMAGVDPEDSSLDLDIDRWGQAFDPKGEMIPYHEYAISKALRGQLSQAMQCHMVRADGFHYDLLVSAAPLVNDGEIVGAVANFMDISEHMRIEEELRHSEVRFRATFEQAAVGVAHVAIDGRWLRVNERLCQITGYTREELLTKTFQDITYKEDLDSNVSNVLALLAGESQTYSMEKRYVRKDGSLVWVELTVSLVQETTPLTLNHSNIDESKYFISVVEDITERKEAELTLQKRNYELDQFAYIVSHDLKAPLRAISNLSEWIEEDLEGQIPVENQQQLQLMRQRVRRMESLINGLLEYSRVGRRDTTIELVSVQELLAEILDSLSPPESFTVTIAPDMPTFKTHRLFLAQIFTNLISNAIKHHPRPDGNVWITVESKEKYYEFAVTDDGNGIPPEHHQRVFALFHTLERSENTESTGIGLAIVKKIIESNGGNIRVESDGHQGTSFRFSWAKGVGA